MLSVLAMTGGAVLLLRAFDRACERIAGLPASTAPRRLLGAVLLSYLGLAAFAFGVARVEIERASAPCVVESARNAEGRD